MYKKATSRAVVIADAHLTAVDVAPPPQFSIGGFERVPEEDGIFSRGVEEDNSSTLSDWTQPSSRALWRSSNC